MVVESWVDRFFLARLFGVAPLGSLDLCVRVYYGLLCGFQPTLLQVKLEREDIEGLFYSDEGRLWA